MNSTVLIGLLSSKGPLANAASQATKRQTLWQNIAAIPHSLLVACYEDDARRKIWETLLHSLDPMGLPRQVFSVFRTLTGHDFLQHHLH
ncbi:hypothetical protein TNCV_3573001 [Trichonephila clavipes]|nr:hypothetical protein TNCV_3573001 [Trichonephila clavipes]